MVKLKKLFLVSNKIEKIQNLSKLKELQILVLDDAKKQNLPDEKLAELYAQFKVEQRVTLADERNKVKVEKLHENKFGWIKRRSPIPP